MAKLWKVRLIRVYEQEVEAASRQEAIELAWRFVEHDGDVEDYNQATARRVHKAAPVCA